MKKKFVIASFAVVIAILGIIGAFLFVKKINKTKQKSIEMSYQRQNYAFFISGDYGMGDQGYEKFHDFSFIKSPNGLYGWLLFYKHDTGNTLTMEEIEEYLSKEFEDDGSLRMSKNYILYKEPLFF